MFPCKFRRVGKPTMITRSDGERKKGNSRVNGRMTRDTTMLKMDETKAVATLLNYVERIYECHQKVYV